jgi:enoyl-CoA hydratase/carnithine racemase
MSSPPPVAPDEPVRYEVRGAVAVLTLNRLATRNALTTELLGALVRALDDAEADDAVRAIVLTGGPSVFASGADVRELRDADPAAYLVSERQSAWQRIARVGKPTVAAVAGPVLGGGCELALHCDLLVAADNAVLGQPEIRLGLLPGAGGTQRWARVVGRYQAAEVVLAARTVDAWTARAYGIAAEVVPAERLVEAAVSLANTIGGFGPVAVRLARQGLRASEEMPISAALALEKSLLATALSTEDHVEGIDALLDKRAPRFTGR